jgi:hypothetical protein
MQKLQKFSTWFSIFCLGAVGMTIGIFVLIGYVLAIPLDRLVRAWLVCLAWFAVWGPLMYLALWRRAKTGGDMRLLFATAAFVGVSGSCLLLYWAYQLRRISGNDFRDLCVTMIIIVPPIDLLLYFIERKWHILR